MTREKAIDWGAASLFAHDRDICELAYLQGETWETFGKSYPKRKAEYMHKSERFLDALTAAGMVVVPIEPSEAMLKSGAVAFYGDKHDVLAGRLPSVYRAMTEAANG